MNSTHLYRTGRAAMRCWCEVFLCGDDRQHLAAVAELAFDEITRVERMLSRFDPASEVFRLNAAPADVSFRVSPEHFAILIECRDWWRKTAGAFDVTIQSTTESLTGDERWNAVRFDPTNHTITRTIEGITFDFGGYGKGYAIDRALAITRQYGIKSACLHAGMSSIVASGPPPDAAGWPIAIQHPEDESRIVTEWQLSHAGMSTSAVSSTTLHDVNDPIKNKPLDQPASCTVKATTAAIAEVWSTALLVRRENTCDDIAVQRVLFV
jgi:FAD:protein FMN transferase